MRQRDVKVGKTYAVKVTDGRLCPVTLTAEAPDDYYSGRERWYGTNLKTGRQLTLTAARLRFEVVKADCGHWLRPDRDMAAHRQMYHKERIS